MLQTADYITIIEILLIEITITCVNVFGLEIPSDN